MSNTLLLQQRQAFLEHARDLKNRLLKPIEEEQEAFEGQFIQNVSEKLGIPELVKQMRLARNDIKAAEKAVEANRDRARAISSKISDLGFDTDGSDDVISFRYGAQGTKHRAAMEKAVSQKFEPKEQAINNKYEAVSLGIWAATTGDQAKELVMSLLK